MAKQGIFFLSRLKHGVNIYNENGFKQLDLVKLLKKYGQLDIKVSIGSKVKLPLRLVAIPLPDEVVNERRRKAKSNRDKRLNPDKDHLYLMGFNIFITNVEQEVWSAKQVAQVYEIRWRIEIVFKAWKSDFKISEIPNASLIRVQSHIYAMLIYITLFQMFCFIPLYHQLYEQQQKHLSLIKLTALLKLIRLFQNWQSINEPFNQDRFIQNILYHCAYEIRKDRLSYPQKIAC
jgi:IS4 transposase